MTRAERRGGATLSGVVIVLAAGLLPAAGAAQTSGEGSSPTVHDLAGLWSAPFPQQELFHVTLQLTRTREGSLRAAVRTPGAREDDLLVWGDDPWVRFQPAGLPLAFHGRMRNGRVEGFLHHGNRATHVVLDPVGRRAWRGEVDLLHFDEPSARFYLGISPGEGSQSAALFLGSSRAPSFFGHDFQGDADGFSFRDLRTGAAFRGRLAARDTLILDTELMGVPVTLSLSPAEGIHRTPAGSGAYRYAAPRSRNDAVPVADARDLDVDPAPLEGLVRHARGGELSGTHAVLLSVRGRLVFEEYFHGFDESTLHDLRSASKSVTAALVGAAIDDELLPGVDAVALSYFPHLAHLENWDPGKALITVEDLLTMRSGLDMVDARSSSAGAEWRYQLSGADWMGYAWDVPVISEPGTEARYGSGNPLLVGGVLDRVTGGRLAHFAHDRLFGPLGVERYAWQMDPTGIPYLAGGMELRPRDQLKLGLLHLNRGTWKGRRILPAPWVDATLQEHATLEGAPARNGYGYLWWHHAYGIGDRRIRSLEARGAGGQYVFVVPSLDLVAVVNSGNYRNGRLRQPETILEDYLLPAVLARPPG